MPGYLPFILGFVALVLVLWGLQTHRRNRVARETALAQVGFSPCEDQKNWLEQIVGSLENNARFRYEVVDPKCLRGQPAVYYYIKRRHGPAHEDSFAEEEVLFALKRASASGLVLIVKPSALETGLATRMIGALATGPWDAQSDDLRRLEIPIDLRNTNLIGALGPPGASLYDLIDTGMLSVVQGLGDAGGMFVRFRDDWCAVSSASAQIPFRVDQIVARIRTFI